MKIVIAGSSGLVGTALAASLLRDGHTVVRLQRPGSAATKDRVPPEKRSSPKPASGEIMDVPWNPNTCDLEGEPFGEHQQQIEGSDALVNLAGASIADESWSAERKAVIRSSRIHI